MTRAEAAAYIAGLSAGEERRLAAFLRMTESPAARPRLLERLRRIGLEDGTAWINWTHEKRRFLWTGKSTF